MESSATWVKKVVWLWSIGMLFLFAGCGSEEKVLGTPGIESAPYVVATNPQNGATSVPLNQVISVLFSTEMDPASITDLSLYMTTNGTDRIPGTVTLDNKVAMFVPDDNLLPFTTYTFVVTTEVTSTEGVHMQEEKRISFTSGTQSGSSSSSSSSSGGAGSSSSGGDTSSSTSSLGSSSSDINGSSSSSADTSSSSSSSSSAAPTGVTTTLGATALTVDETNSQVLNPLVGGLLGIDSLNIDVLGWQGLAGANIDLPGLLGAVNDQLGGVGTVQDLLNSTLTVEELYTIIADQLGVLGLPDAEATVETIISALTGGAVGNLPLQIGDLIQLPDELLSIPVDELLANEGLATTVVNTLSLVTSLAESANYTLGEPIELPINLPLVNGTAKVKLINPPVIAVLHEGSTIYSAATRVYLDLQANVNDLAGLTNTLGGISGVITDSGLVNDTLGLLDGLLGGLLGGLGVGDLLNLGDLLSVEGDVLHIPIYLEIGVGEAELTSLTPTSIIMNASSGLAKAFLGDIDESFFFSAESLNESDFTPVEILNLAGLVSVTGKAYAESAGGAQTLTFGTTTFPQIQSVYGPLGDDVNTLIFSLLGNLDLQVEAIGLTIDPADLSDLTDAVTAAIVTSVFPAVGDSLLNPLGMILGTSAGRTDVTLLGLTY